MERRLPDMASELGAFLINISNLLYWISVDLTGVPLNSSVSSICHAEETARPLPASSDEWSNKVK